ncbi:unnamed protein product [Cuscuta campestris]|uniref:Transposase Tc1-like domain-containing protein n=1 Tax=Cuscuta campestris TaxID=132261 RepID=A0A484LHL8_9ASTE|nr:unnamed protein product [Cuscuta campestris]
MGTQTAQRGAVQSVAAEFNVSRQTISSLWRKAKAQLQVGVLIDVSSRMAGNVGRKRAALDFESITLIPLRRRTTIRSLASSVGISKSTVHNWVKRSILRSHTNAIKPTLNDANRRQRLIFCLQQLEETSIPSNPTFKGFKNVLHIDEKWFFMTKTSQRYYLTPDEDELHRTCQSK